MPKTPQERALEVKPFRLRSKRYLSFIRQNPCVICGAKADAHHLQFMQPRAMGKKTGDQWCIALCRLHHSELHESHLSEPTWWATYGIIPEVWAKNKYAQWAKENEGLQDG